MSSSTSNLPTGGLTPPADPGETTGGAAQAEVARSIVGEAALLGRYARRLTRSSADAADLTQDTLERALRGVQGFRPGSNLRAWLLTIMSRLFVDRCRKGKRETNRDPLDPDCLAAPASGDEAAPRWARLGEREVRVALSQLDSSFREPYELFAVEHLSYQAVAQRLRIPVGTVGTRLNRARLKLRALLERELEVDS
jgi:RNA polymerase sigma-70 factor (ECF subfamily)